MKSFINKKNASKIPYSIIVFFLFLYICPNIKYFGVGEMSYLPGLIILFAYSFLDKAEFLKYFALFFLCLIWPFLIYSSEYLVNYSSISYLVSLYILTIPILSSVLLGRIIGIRFAENKKIDNQNEIKKTIILLSFSLLLSGVLNKINPSILNTILYTGRTSAGRWTFFFTEPSQASSVLLIFWFASLHVIFRRNFYNFLGKNKSIYFLFIIFVTLVFTYLSLPITLLAQILIFFLLIILIYFASYLIKLIFSNNFYIINLFNRKIKKHSFYSITLFFISIISGYFLFYQKNALLLYRLNSFVFGSENFLFSIFYIGGFRVYYSFAALIASFKSPLHFPGMWSGKFAPEMISILNDFNIMQSDEFLQLSKSFSVIKPLGWFYFSIYDFGILGFIIFCLLFFRRYINYFIKGIFKTDFMAISLFSAQISLFIIPTLPSTPSVFFPLLIYCSLISYSESVKKKLIIQN